MRIADDQSLEERLKSGIAAAVPKDDDEGSDWITPEEDKQELDNPFILPSETDTSKFLLQSNPMNDAGTDENQKTKHLVESTSILSEGDEESIIEKATDKANKIKEILWDSMHTRLAYDSARGDVADELKMLLEKQAVSKNEADKFIAAVARLPLWYLLDRATYAKLANFAGDLTDLDDVGQFAKTMLEAKIGREQDNARDLNRGHTPRSDTVGEGIKAAGKETKETSAIGVSNR